MIGTAKQVKWAEDIRAKKMSVINDALASMAKKLAAKPAELEMVQALRNELASKSASFWIDARDDFALDIMRKVGKEILSRTSQTTEQGKTMDKQENSYMAYGSKDGAAFFCTAPSTYGNKNPEIGDMYHEHVILAIGPEKAMQEYCNQRNKLLEPVELNDLLKDFYPTH